jgi:mycothiol synthase
LIHERDGQMAGFCWTKVHGRAGHDHHHGHDAIGEIYVIGVDPHFRGHGLGRTLTIAGLSHLRAQEVPAAMLYVDAENNAAITLYQGLGFTEWGRDVMYRASRGQQIGAHHDQVCLVHEHGEEAVLSRCQSHPSL